MQQDASALINNIRSRTDDERRLLAEMAATAPNLKPLLKPASSFLDSVESFFLDPAILAEPRSDAERLRWLRNGEAELKRAIERREYVADLIEKFGADAKLFYGLQ